LLPQEAQIAGGQLSPPSTRKQEAGREPLQPAMTGTRYLGGLLIWIGLCFGAGLFGSLFTAHSVDTWYLSLNKPTWTPPNSVFAPVWSLLYLLMGLAAWLVWRQGGFRTHPTPLYLFLLQLSLNAAWSLVFFRLRLPGAAFAEILALWALILAVLMAFWRAVPLAGALLVPYLLWVTFASALNFAIWRLNS